MLLSTIVKGAILLALLLPGVAFAQRPQPPTTDTLSLALLAPTHMPLTGSVSDDRNNPLAGVMVKLHGSAPNGELCITNSKGKYVLTVPVTGGKVTVSFAGYQTQEFEFRKVSHLDVVLQPEPGFKLERKAQKLYRQFNKSNSVRATK